MTIRISSEDIVAAAAVVTAIASILGMVFALYRWYLRQNRDTEEIKKVKA